MSVKTQGSQLYILDTTDSSGCALLKVECVTNFGGLSNPREQIDVTCMESDSREFVGGLSTPGQLNVTVNFDPRNESHMKLYEFWKSNSDNFKAAIGFGGPRDTDPTIASGACDFDFPTERTFIAFDGYVVDVPLEGAVNSVWTSVIPIQISGPYTIFPAVEA